METLLGALGLVLIIFLIATTTLHFAEDYGNREDRLVNQCQQVANETDLYSCQRYSVYAESTGTCSCILQNTDLRITFPNTWGQE